MSYQDLKRKITVEERVYLESLNVVSKDENAHWLIDYWCKKDVRGLILMPFSRHWIMHIEASIRIRNKVIGEEHGLVQASIEQLSIIKNITIETIKDIYPHFYPKGAVDFFVSHHNDENISHDIIDKNVYLLYMNKIAIGTITIKENEICRLFVLPQYQRKGY